MHSRRFRQLWAANAVSNLGDGLRVTALPLLAASLTRDPTAIAAITALVWLPWLLFGIVGGAIVDRMPRVRLLTAVQLGRMAVVAALAGIVWSGHASMPIIYAVTFAIGIGEVLADTTMQTLVPSLVPERDLERANGRLFAAQAVSNDFVGPPVGSVLFATLAASPFVANAATWGASAVLLSRLTVAGPSRPDGQATTFAGEIASGARWLWRHRMLRALLIWGAVVNASLTAFSSISVLFALEVLGISEAAFGFLAAAIGAGGIAGTLVAGRLVRLVGRSRLIQGGAVLGGAGAMVAGLLSSAIAFAAVLMLLTASAAVVSIVVASLRQSIVPNELLGRVHATFRVFSYGSIPLGALAGGWIAAAYGLRVPFLVGGAIVVLAGLVIGRWVTDAAMDEARRTAGHDVR